MYQLGLTELVKDGCPRFDSYWPGDNVFVVAAVRGLSETNQERSIFVHGPSGVGKTHLGKSLWYLNRDQDQRTAYLPLDQAKALDPALIDRWGEFDLVVLDGLEAVAGDLTWERALFRLLEELREKLGRVLALGRKPPDALRFQLEDLGSRLAWGPVYRLTPLNDVGLEDLSLHLAKQRGLDLPRSVAKYLVQTLKRDPKSISGAIEKLDQAALTAQRRLTLPFVRAVLLRME